jgi:hypothetical protein
MASVRVREGTFRRRSVPAMRGIPLRRDVEKVLQ